MRTTIALVTLLLLSAQATAINKCVGPDGKVFYQDTLCPTDAGKALQATPNTVERTEAERQAAKGELTPEQKKQAAADKKALDAQTAHAKKIQADAQAEERKLAARNAAVRSKISRASPTPGGRTTAPESAPAKK